MPTDQTIDFVIIFILVGLTTLGLGSVVLGWVVRTWDRVVNRSQVVMSDVSEQTARTERTNERTNERSSHQVEWDAFWLDRTRARLISVMVDSDLTTTEIRALLKGESKTIGDEVDAARLRLGKPAPDQYRTPIAGRPTSATYQEQDSELRYQSPPA